MLYLVGLGLGDERDITLKGLEAVRRCGKVYLEAYTSVIGAEKATLEAFYGKEVIIADRELVEIGADSILADAQSGDVAFLVVGDALGATTHTDLMLRAYKRNIKVEVVHNASIMNAVGVCGLQLYNFGQAVSIVMFTETWRPQSFYDKIKLNHDNGFHTLCLLGMLPWTTRVVMLDIDIKMKEPNEALMLKGKIVYEPPRFMTINMALEQLIEVEHARGEKVYDLNTKVVGVARVGHASQKIAYGSISKLVHHDFGPPLHSLIIPGRCHELELEMLRQFAIE